MISLIRKVPRKYCGSWGLYQNSIFLRDSDNLTLPSILCFCQGEGCLHTLKYCTLFDVLLDFCVANGADGRVVSVTTNNRFVVIARAALSIP